eukprot:scaffold27893_cov17-Tisochrysis_lutea.AAC.1
MAVVFISWRRTQGGGIACDNFFNSSRQLHQYECNNQQCQTCMCPCFFQDKASVPAFGSTRPCEMPQELQPLPWLF